MLIGRIGLHNGIKGFALDHGSCGCYILCTPLFSVTLYSKQCKCSSCGEFECKCTCPLCFGMYSKCDCEKFS